MSVADSQESKQLYSEGCPCNNCPNRADDKRGCTTSMFTGCDVLFEWFYPGSIEHPKRPGEQ